MILKRIAIFVIAIAGLIHLPCPPCPAATPARPPAVEEFPVYGVIRPNIAFWTDIFTKHSKSEGVIHDVRDLSKRYGLVKLNPADTRKAASQNRKKKKKAIKKYKNLLLKLSRGVPPSSPMEKKVAALFGKHPKPSHFKRAAYNLRIQTGLKEQFKEGIIRSGALVNEFKRIFKASGLPQDLVYLPCVESSFNPAAYSKFGAAGIWQFTRGTGKRYMDIGYVVDERRDPVIATRGAAQLLKKNYGELKSWPLAITAYNHGLAGMKRAQKKHRTYPKIYTSYTSRSFKFASRNFYAEFLAAREVAKNHTKYFGRLALDRPARHSRFKTKGFLPAEELARKLGLDIPTLRKLNPALRKPVFDGRKYIPKGYTLRLPEGIAAEAAAQAAAAIYLNKQKPSRFHRVARGDTAGSIARTHRVPLKDLIIANGLGRRATIYIGQTLRIPVGSRGEPAAVKTAAVKAAVSAPSPPAPKPEPAKVLKKEPPAPRETAAETASAIPAPDGAERPVVTADLKIKKTIQGKKSMLGVIHAAPGETLGHYADWLGIATARIRKLNGLTYGRPISMGQTIKLPLAGPDADQFEEKRYEFHQEILEDFFDSFFISGTGKYEIKPGDTIWDLCENQLEIPLWLLEKYNPAMDINRLMPGQTLVYPEVSPNGVQVQPMDSDIRI
ncbi:MAG: transglycosylase SLT domain-containing protein [Desulfobacter sp.]|nr:MAG: transglycosylase SLT domain-containing protein [Desulfobacter sp.]